MKKLFVLMAAAFAMVACQTDINEVGVAGGEVDVTFEVGTPTRAYSDGKTATVLQYAVYDENGTELDALTHSIAKDNVVNFELKTKVDFKLVTGNTYTVIFWAAADGAPYTFKPAEKTITVNYDAAVCNDENRDAFYKKHTFTVNGAQTETIELRRPFAQLNIGTNDYDEATEAGYTPKYSAVTVKNIYSTLNLWDGAVDKNSAVEVDFDYAEIAKGETFPVTGYQYLAMNYLLVDAEKEVVDIEFGYKEENTAAKTRTVGSVPVQRNHRTNIYGQLLTSDVDINIEIKPAYDEPAHTADALFHAAAFGGEVTLTENVELKAPLKVQSNMVLNLNGKTITTTEQSAGRHHYAIDNYATLVIEGEGAIDARGIENFGTLIINGNVTITNVDTNGGAAIWNEGKLTVNNGTFKTNATAGVGSYGAALITCANGEAIVNGGTFIANSQLTYAILNEGKTTIYNANVKGKHGAVGGPETASATTEIYGGSFELMENPGVSDHCTYYVSAIYGGKFSLGKNTDSGAQVFYESAIANGYKAIVKDSFHYVVAETADEVATSKEELVAALKDASVEAIVLAEGVTYEGSFVISRDVKITSAGSNKATLKGRVSIVSASPTFVNVKFDRNETDSNKDWDATTYTNKWLGYLAVVMIYGESVDTVKFEGCEFYNSKGTDKSSITNTGCELILNNCYLHGTSSSIYTHANVSLCNSTIDYTGTSNVVLSITGCGNKDGKVIFKGNTVVNNVYAVGQFLSTVAFGGTYYFDVQNYENFTKVFANESRVTNKEFAPGSYTF